MFAADRYDISPKADRGDVFYRPTIKNRHIAHPYTVFYFKSQQKKQS